MSLRGKEWCHWNSVKREIERQAAFRSYCFAHWGEKALLWVHLVMRSGFLICCQIPAGHIYQLNVGVCFFCNRILLCSPGWPWTCILPHWSLKTTGVQDHIWPILGSLNSQTQLFNSLQRTQKWTKAPGSFSNSPTGPELPFGSLSVWRLICIQPWCETSQDSFSSILSLSKSLGTARADTELTSCPHLLQPSPIPAQR